MNFKEPIYKQIVHTIMGQIERGELLPGQKIPSERELAALLGVNRMTVKNAILHLEENGVLERYHGKGTFVRKDRRKLSSAVRGGISEKAKEAGASVFSKIIYAGQIEKYPYLEKKLELPSDGAIYALYRVRYLDKVPSAVEYTYLAESYFPDIGQYDFSSISLYEYMKNQGHIPVFYKEEMYLSRLLKREAKYLNLQEDTLAYTEEVVGYGEDGTALEYTKSYYHVGQVSYTFEIKVSSQEEM